MNSPADISRRSRRFFGFGGIVRRLRRRAVDGDGPSPRREPPPTETDRALQSERARFAAKLDLELRRACRSEARIRRELGCAARAFMRRRAYWPLGFVRLSDYARERLGVSARTLHDAAWLATRLDALPAISSAYDRSELSWAAARAICKVATVADEEQWLDLARRSTVETLERLVARADRPDGIPTDPQGEPNEIDGEPAVRWRFLCPSRIRALWRRALELASRAAGEPLVDWRAAEIVAAEGSSGRPPGASMGDRVLIEALRMARRDRRRNAVAATVADAHVASAVREPLVATVGAGLDVGAKSGLATTTSAPAGSTSGCATSPISASRSGEEPARVLDQKPPAFPSDVTAPADLSSDGDRGDIPTPADPFALDARLAESVRVLRTIEPRIGRLLRVVVDQRIHRSFGHAAFQDYVRERLGISLRKAWALLEIEKATIRSADFDRAYRDGTLSWVRALSLLPVLDRATAPAWIARAESVTVRRLNDEVEWVLASRDALGPDFCMAPPPVDGRLPWPTGVTAPNASGSSDASATPNAVANPDERRDLSPDARLQIRAHGTPTTMRSASERQNLLEVADAEIRFTGPASVVTLFGTCSMRSRIRQSRAGQRSNDFCDTSSPIGKARRAIPIRSSPATAGAAPSPRAAPAGTSTTITSASARAAATIAARTARPSARPTISTDSTPAPFAHPASPRMQSNGSSASAQSRLHYLRASAIESADPTIPTRESGPVSACM